MQPFRHTHTEFSQTAVEMLETLRQDNGLVLHRGVSGVDRSPVLVLASAAQPPPPGTLQRLEHEYAYREELDSGWAVKPLALFRNDGRPMLVLTDPGGELLSRLVGGPWQISELLRVALGIATALGRVHERGLIHKDVKPANLLVNTVSGAAWLTGFALASRLPREHQVLGPPEVVAGTLAYMAPEQTGRMNRSMDSRSDLYAFGVTLYELLTGTLPFTAADPIEWIHCHVARQPVPPMERAAQIPTQLSAIVMKLLAKTPEERYQTASGVEADLRRCLGQWESTGRIASFPLGAQDASEQLVIPEKLYGRETEAALLLAAFDRVAVHGKPELALVSGYSGIGKSSVVNELHKVVPPRGTFISGKFDQRVRDTPYSTLAEGFGRLIRQILDSSEENISRWRGAIREAAGDHGSLLIELIPELVHLMGAQQPVATLSALETRLRFQTVFQRFVGVFSRAGQPLVMFIDDLQWLDPATLTLIEHLLTHPDTRHLLIIGAYRDNEIGPEHPLTHTLETVRQGYAKITELVLGPLSADDLNQLVCDALRCGSEKASSLAQLVHRKTDGNPFFAGQFLTSLAEEGLLKFDPTSKSWTWDLEGIDRKDYTDNLVDLMVTRLRRLPDSAQEVLKLLAAVGNQADSVTLAKAYGGTEQVMQESFRAAVGAGAVLAQEAGYRFLHDRVQEAAYALIPVESRAQLHLRIGRLLAQGKIEEDEIFAIANQLNLGSSLVSEQAEREQVARFNLQAGRKAKTSTAFASACGYLAAGMAILREEGWDRCYELASGLWLERVECEVLNSNFDEAAQRVKELLARSRSKIDRAKAYRQRMILELMRGNNAAAVQTALECLQTFGLQLPEHPTREDVESEYEEVHRNLRERPIESLAELPPMSDPEIGTVMQILSTLLTAAYVTDSNLFQMAACRGAKLSQQHGLTESAAIAFSAMGIFLGPVFHRFKEGERFSRLGLEMSERHGFTAQRAAANFGMQLAALWTRPIADALPWLDAGIAIGKANGEITFACYCLEHRLAALMARGDPLDQIWRESVSALEFVQRAKFRQLIDIISSVQPFIQALRGQVSDGPPIDEAALEARVLQGGSPNAVCYYWMLQLQRRFLFRDAEGAIDFAVKARPTLWAARFRLQSVHYCVFHSLALAEAFASAGPETQAEWRGTLIENLRSLERWAESCSATYLHKYLLVAAECARLEGRQMDAMRLYEQAIRSAADHGFIQFQALANELAARFYFALGMEKVAQTYLREARDGYTRWGAYAKVAQLDQNYPDIQPHAPASRPTSIDASVEQLELAAVLKMSQTLSGEIVIARLIETLMTIALEHAGAERGLLILRHTQEARIEAEATTGRDGVTVRLVGTQPTPSDLPESMLQHVIRSRQSVIVDDANADNPFSGDEYILRKRPRSILCLPLVKQTALVGVLYLENRLASHVFTSARCSVLELLSSQAAISLQNARLYTELDQENSDRRRAEEALRQSEERYARAMDAADDGVWEWRPATDEVFLSARARKLFGVPEGIEIKTRADLKAHGGFHPQDGQRIEEAIQACFARRSGGFEIEYRVMSQTGEQRWIQSRGKFFADTHGRPALLTGALTDVTERHQAQIDETRFRGFFDLPLIGMAVSLPDRRFLEVNQKLCQILGYSRDELVGRDWASITHPDDVAGNLAFLSESLRGENESYSMEKRYIHRDGHVVYASISVCCVRRSDGAADHFVLTVQDVTERQQAEEERRELERQLRQAQRLEAMGTLAGGIAHDFNNILGSILGYGERALRSTEKGSRLQRDVDSIMAAGERGRALVDRVLAFTRSSASERVAVHVERVVREAIDLIEAKLPEGIRVEAGLRAGPAAIMGDPTQVHQVVMNLATNAVQAMPSGGTLSVSLDVARVDVDRTATIGTIAAGEFLVLKVADTGTGIAPDIVDRIFDPFFTTKEAGVGTGLGLSLVLRLVADVDGAIDVTTAVGAGSAFTVFLPRAGDAAAWREDEEPQMPRGNGQRVLIVDDEEPLARLATRTLEELGYVPVAFTSSVAALAAFRADPQRFDAVITDERMPGITGAELIHQIRSVRSSIRILLVSGYVGGSVMARAYEEGVDEVLKKPVSAYELAASLARLLQG